MNKNIKEIADIKNATNNGTTCEQLLNMPLTLNVALPITVQTISDLLSNAFSSCGYWLESFDLEDMKFNLTEYANAKEKKEDIEICWEEKIAMNLIHGGSYKVRVYEEKSQILTLEKLLNGYSKWIVEGISRNYSRNGFNYGYEFTNMDGDSADSILQYALFNDIIFG